MRKILCILICLALPSLCLADNSDVIVPDNAVSLADLEQAAIEQASTPCATKYFADGLANTANNIHETDPEQVIQQWIYEIFYDKNILENVLKCPELQSLADDDAIRFTPIQYTFPNGRLIAINYETQPKIIKQRILMANKRTLPSSDPNPRIGANDDPSIWTNTDPAWYAIMVVESGALNEFVGPNKNNTISLKYINDNIDSFYPNATFNGGLCTSRSAIARNKLALNRAGALATGDDSNDYYVAGDINLAWIGYAEMAADVIIGVATMGGSTILSGTIKGARAVKVLNDLRKSMGALMKIDKVRDYAKHLDRVKQLTKELEMLDTASDVVRGTSYADELAKVGVKVVTDKNGVTRYMGKNGKFLSNDEVLKRIDDLPKGAKSYAEELAEAGVNVTTDKNGIIRYRDKAGKYISHDEVLKRIDDLPNIRKQERTKEIEQLKETMEKMKKDNPDVKKYAEQADVFEEVYKYGKKLKGLRPQTGNVLTRGVKLIKGIHAARNGNKILAKGAKAARASKLSTRVKDWLFHSTLKSASTLSRMVGNTGAIYTTLKFVGEMWDFTETSTGDFTNNVDFKPLLLLSADDIKGQENVVNYGMWLMWAGDSMNPADDDAAYLQAMDFAAKFHEDLMEVQNDTNSPCNVDIYVVRPVLRGIDTDNPELYYLIMNDIPWTTN